MKNLHLLPIGVFLFFSTACNESVDLPLSPSDEICQVTISRSSQEPESLPEGAKVMFNAQGGLTANNQILTYSEGQWEANTPLHWNDIPDSTTYTALYPVYEDFSYSTENLYTDSGLRDLLIAQDTLTGKQDIELSFKHLFSQLIIHVSHSIQEKIVDLRLTVPYTVTSISSDGHINTTDIAHTTTLAKNESGSYSFLLPPMKNCHPTIELTTIDATYSQLLAANTFESHIRYECNLRSSIGIKTAEDLIAFSRLINGISYSGKTLDDFGEKIGNDSIFYLLNDITLTEESCKKLLPIGYYDKRGFKYIFEGNNHTISNLTVPDKSVNTTVDKSYCGLFGYISSDGTVRNLHITHAKTVEEPTYTLIGILAGQNFGNIIHCSVDSSSIALSSAENIYAQSFICARNRGSIINCFATNNSIKTGANSMVASITGDAAGHILNCYAYKNTFTYKSKAAIGGIAGMSDANKPLTITNCCTSYNISYKNFGAVISESYSDTINHIFYNGGNIYDEMLKSAITNCYKYNSKYQVDGKHISTYLNEWIDSIGTTSYPNIKFKKWTTDTSVLPTFQ